MVDTIAPSILPLVIIETINSQRDGHFLSLSMQEPSHARTTQQEKEEPASRSSSFLSRG
jgi:hypothetical protein